MLHPLFSALAIAVAAAPLAAAAPVAPHALESLALVAGRSQLLELPRPLTRVAISDPRVMDVRVIGDRQLLVQALRPGNSSMQVWTRDAQARSYDVKVGADVQAVTRQLRTLTGNDTLVVDFNGKAFLLSGVVQSPAQRDAAEKIVASWGLPVVDLIANNKPASQVAIEVYVVELAKSSGLNLGASYGGGEVTDIANGVRKYIFKPGELMAGEAAIGNPASFGTLDFLAAKLQLMQNRGEAKLLARPTLVTVDGGTAKFLAGGEIPIPIQQALGTTTIAWKEFGVRLEIAPSVQADGRIALSVRPEVSSLDFANGLKQASYAIPALKTRRVETQVVLAAQETLMLGGLLNNEQNRSYQLIPGIGDVPVLGELFRSRNFLDNQSELAILVTPRLMAPSNELALPGRLPAVQRELGTP